MKAKATVTLNLYYDNVKDSEFLEGLLKNVIAYVNELGLLEEPEGPVLDDMSSDIKVEVYK